jgi:hypothetical protein
MKGLGLGGGPIGDEFLKGDEEVVENSWKSLKRLETWYRMVKRQRLASAGGVGTQGTGTVNAAHNLGNPWLAGHLTLLPFLIGGRPS